jgi:hypothetical protein
MSVVEIRNTFTRKLKMLALIISYRHMSGAMSGQKGGVEKNMNRERYR